MGTFYFYYQNPLGFCFLLQIRAFVIRIFLGLPNLKMKENTKWILNSNQTSSCKWLIALTFQGRCPCQCKLISFLVNFVRNRVLAIRERPTMFFLREKKWYIQSKATAGREFCANFRAFHSRFQLPCSVSRPCLRYLPSLPALKDWWDESNETRKYLGKLN